jgi:hypothetical protein
VLNAERIDTITLPPCFLTVSRLRIRLMSMMCRKLPSDGIHLLVPTKLPRARDSITILLELKVVRGGLFLHGSLSTSSRIRNQEQYHQHVGSLEKSSSFRSI